MGSGVDWKFKYNYLIFIIFFLLKKIFIFEYDDNRDQYFVVGFGEVDFFIC